MLEMKSPVNWTKVRYRTKARCHRLDKSQVPQTGQGVKCKIGLGTVNWTELRRIPGTVDWTALDRVGIVFVLGVYRRKR